MSTLRRLFVRHEIKHERPDVLSQRETSPKARWILILRGFLAHEPVMALATLDGSQRLAIGASLLLRLGHSHGDVGLRYLL